MNNRLTKYILLFGILLLALPGQFQAYSGSTDKAVAAHVLSGACILEYNAGHVSVASLAIVTENHKTCIPSDNDNEEESFSGHAKKLVKAALALPSSYHTQMLAAANGYSHSKSLQHYSQSALFSPYRPYIRFRVIRI